MKKWKLQKLDSDDWCVVSPSGQGVVYSGTWEDGLKQLWRDIKMNPHLCDPNAPWQRERKQKENG